MLDKLLRKIYIQTIIFILGKQNGRLMWKLRKKSKLLSHLSEIEPMKLIKYKAISTLIGKSGLSFIFKLRGWTYWLSFFSPNAEKPKPIKEKLTKPQRQRIRKEVISNWDKTRQKALKIGERRNLRELKKEAEQELKQIEREINIKILEELEKMLTSLSESELEQLQNNLPKRDTKQLRDKISEEIRQKKLGRILIQDFNPFDINSDFQLGNVDIEEVKKYRKLTKVLEQLYIKQNDINVYEPEEKGLNSRWLWASWYDARLKTCDILMNNRKVYRFFGVPKSKWLILTLDGGKEMWNYFGRHYSTNPLRWIRQNEINPLIPRRVKPNTNLIRNRTYRR